VPCRPTVSIAPAYRAWVQQVAQHLGATVIGEQRRHRRPQSLDQITNGNWDEGASRRPEVVYHWLLTSSIIVVETDPE